MATATASDASVEVTPDEPEAATPAETPHATRFRVILLGVLAVVLVVSGASAVALGSSRHVWPFGAGTDPAQTDREAVMAQTQQFVLRRLQRVGLFDAQIGDDRRNPAALRNALLGLRARQRGFHDLDGRCR